MTGVIYALEWNDGRVYVGQTIDLARREREHRRNQADSAFNVRVLERVPVDDLNPVERRWHKFYALKHSMLSKMTGNGSVGAAKSGAAGKGTPKPGAGNGAGLRALSSDEQRRRGDIGRKQTAKRQKKCTECGMISIPMAIGRHQRFSGHTGTEKLPDREWS